MKLEEFRQNCQEQSWSPEQIAELELALKHGLNINILLQDSYSAECMHEIVLGMLHSVDVYAYAKGDGAVTDSDIMRYCRLGMEIKCPMAKYANGDYSARQLELIYNGYANNIDVSRYDCPDYSPEKMFQCYTALLFYPDKFDGVDFADYDEYQLHQINEACRQNLPVDLLLNHDFNDMQMQQIRLGERSGVAISEYARNELNSEQMCQIRLGMEHNVETSVYNDIKFDAGQMKQIRLGQEQGVDISYATQGFSGNVMKLIRLGLLEGLEISEYAVPGISDEEALSIFNYLMELQTSISGVGTDDIEIKQSYLNLIGFGSEDNQDVTNLSDDFRMNYSIGGVTNTTTELDGSNVFARPKNEKNTTKAHGKKAAVRKEPEKEDFIETSDETEIVTDTSVPLSDLETEKAPGNAHNIEQVLSQSRMVGNLQTSEAEQDGTSESPHGQVEPTMITI